MSADFTVDVSELNTLAADFQRSSRVAQRLASAVVRKTAFQIVGTAQTFVPVDTGATRASIHASAESGGSLGAESLTAEIGPTTNYAPYLEFGTSRMGPHAFMGPALDRHTPDFVAGIEHIADILDGDPT